MHVIAAKAVCFKEALESGFKTYQKQVIDNAQAMAEVFIKRGYDVVSGGTDNHLFLVSLIRQGLTGKDADAALGRAHARLDCRGRLRWRVPLQRRAAGPVGGFGPQRAGDL